MFFAQMNSVWWLGYLIARFRALIFKRPKIVTPNILMCLWSKYYWDQILRSNGRNSAVGCNLSLATKANGKNESNCQWHFSIFWQFSCQKFLAMPRWKNLLYITNIRIDLADWICNVRFPLGSIPTIPIHRAELNLLWFIIENRQLMRQAKFLWVKSISK